MSVVIRLSRHGKKGQPFYHIVAADSRRASKARFIEKIGTYNPRTNPASVSIRLERAIHWLQKGAKPSDTARTLLSGEGILYKLHLQRGVSKAVLTQEQADAKYAQWLTGKEAKTKKLVSALESSKRELHKKRLSQEAEAREKRSAKRKPKEVPAEASSSENQPSTINHQPSIEAPASDVSAPTPADAAATPARLNDEVGQAEVPASEVTTSKPADAEESSPQS